MFLLSRKKKFLFAFNCIYRDSFVYAINCSVIRFPMRQFMMSFNLAELSHTLFPFFLKLLVSGHICQNYISLRCLLDQFMSLEF